jgi:hypothetical protein
MRLIFLKEKRSKSDISSSYAKVVSLTHESNEEHALYNFAKSSGFEGEAPKSAAAILVCEG